MNKSTETCIAKSANMEINIRIEDAASLKFIDFNFKHTQHSFLRAAQRGINSMKIRTALQYGESIYKQGLIYFILGESNIPDSLIKEKDKLKNTVVIVSGNSNELITCYRSADPYRNIKHKSKKLCKNYNHAA